MLIVGVAFHAFNCLDLFRGTGSAGSGADRRQWLTEFAIFVKLMKQHCFSLSELIISISPYSPKSFRSFSTVYLSKSSMLPTCQVDIGRQVKSQVKVQRRGTLEPT